MPRRRKQRNSVCGDTNRDVPLRRGSPRVGKPLRICDLLSGRSYLPEREPFSLSEVKSIMFSAVSALETGLGGKQLTPGQWLRVVINTAMDLKKGINNYGLVRKSSLSADAIDERIEALGKELRALTEQKYTRESSECGSGTGRKDVR